MLRPRQDYILVKPTERLQSKTITVISDERHCRGEVIAVGPGKCDKRGRIQPLATRVGDIVIFGNGESNLDLCYPRHEENGVVYRIVQEADIAGIVEREQADLAA